MGEAKRRGKKIGDNIHLTDNYAPEVRALPEAGQPINIHMLGAGVIVPEILRLEQAGELMKPQHHVLRVGFEAFDRIRTGELNPWSCGLCSREFSGYANLSVLAVIERTLGEPKRDKPALSVFVCHGCDSVSAEETKRRVQQMFGVLPLQEGRA
jgi:hypothetical protein